MSDRPTSDRAGGGRRTSGGPSRSPFAATPYAEEGNERPPAPASAPSRACEPASEAPHPLHGPAAPPPAPEDAVPIVAIGASAGGLEAAMRLLESLPEEPGAAFVLLRHLPPRDTAIAEVLAARTRLPVALVRGGERPHPDRVHVAPPARALVLEDGRFRLVEISDGGAASLPIDGFLRSLARERGARAALVLLSGMGSDGTAGARALREAGGVVFAQDPADARHEDMPRAAIRAGVADRVLPAAEIGSALGELLRLPSFRGDGQAGRLLREAEAELPEIVGILRERSGHDFSHYKSGTLRRRILRRMSSNGLDSIADYRELLAERSDEADALASDLLIGVTRFFRDPPAFDALARDVVPALVERTPLGGTIRAWVAGCSTGEEAYSIAILLLEGLEDADGRALQVFATDVDPADVDVARAGRYPASIEEDVSAERLERYFEREDGGYRVRPTVRERMTFSVQNALTDPPFSQLDLLACRNLFIYLLPEAQEGLLAAFHFALKPDGFLFLGTAEGVGGHAELFSPVNKRWRVYRRLRKSPPPAYPPRFQVSGRKLHSAERPVRPRPPGEPMQYKEVAERKLLEHFAPSAVMVNARNEVLHFAGRTAGFLEPPVGEPSTSLLELALPGLRSRLRSVLHRLTREGATQATSTALLPASGRRRPRKVRITGRRLQDTGLEEETFLVTFLDLPVGEEERASAPSESPRQEEIVRELERELDTTREELKRTISELEQTNEELRASNEEVMSMNEEFQSTNEELETSKEELQSLNDELVASNARLQAKVGEVESAKNDISNLLAATDVGTIFLDRELRIQWFSPAVTRLVRLIPTDFGRPLTDIASEYVDGALLEEARRVLAGESESSERELDARTGEAFLRRILPYRSPEGEAEGVVVTFVDVTAQRRAAEADAHLAAIVQGSNEATISMDPDLVVTSWNPGAQRMYGYTAEEMIGRSIRTIVPEHRLAELEDLFEKCRRGERAPAVETERMTKDGRILDVLLSFSPVKDASGRTVAVAAIGRDVTEWKRAEREIRESEERFRAMANSAPVMIWLSDAEGSFTWLNSRWLEFTGRTLEQEVGDGWIQGVHPDDRKPCLDAYRASFDARRSFRVEFRLRGARGGHRWILGEGTPRYREDGEFLGFIGSCIDITENREAREALADADRRKDEFLAILGHELRNPLSTIRLATELLRTGEKDQIEWSTGTIQTQIDVMARLLDDLLELTRVTQGKLRLRRSAVRASDVARKAVESCCSLPGCADREIRVRVEPESLTLDADPVRLEQVLTNLLTNALRHSDPGEPTELEARAEDGSVAFSVRDGGSGMDEETLRRVFEPFYQARGASSGLGVGLTLVRHLVEAHGGSVEAQSDGPGTGSEFTVRFPGAHLEAAAPAREASGPEPTVARRILVVDDNEPAARLLEILLGERGHSVRTATSGDAALAVAREQKPEIAFLDLKMPGMDGFELARRLRAELGDAPRIVALTGFGEKRARDRTAAAGFDAHLVKGAGLPEIEQLLAELP